MDPSNGFSGGGDQNLVGRGSGGGGIAAPRGYAMSGKIMLSAIVVLFTVVLLILFLHLYVRWRLLRTAARRGRRRGRRLVFAVDGRVINAGAAGRGLDSDALKSLPTLAFSVAVGGGDAGECAVCLSEFEEGEKVRSVPRCGHLFHIECINSWLRSHVTCPLCRAAVEAEKPAPPAEQLAVPAAESDSSATAGLASSPSDLCESCRIEDGTSSSSEVRIEVRSGAEDELGFGIGSSSGFKTPLQLRN